VVPRQATEEVAPGKDKDKQVWVVFDDDEVSSDEGTPLQKRL
jgi:hypothetical protein